MGQFKVTVTLHPQNGGTARTVEALVDTGAGYSMFPRPLLEALGCQPIRSQHLPRLSRRHGLGTTPQEADNCREDDSTK